MNFFLVAYDVKYILQPSIIILSCCILACQLGIEYIVTDLENMADTTTGVRSNHQIDGSSQPPMKVIEPVFIPRFMRGHLSRTYDEYQVHQRIYIERETLKFLKKCRKFKRTPQSIRISGANAMHEPEKLIYFSKFESTLLDHQIKSKEKHIVELLNKGKDEPHLKLPCIDRKKLHRHFKKN